MENYFPIHNMERMRLYLGCIVFIILLLPLYFTSSYPFQGLLFPIIGMVVFILEVYHLIRRHLSATQKNGFVRVTRIKLLISKSSIIFLVILFGLYASQFFLSYFIESSSFDNLQIVKTLSYEITKNATTDFQKAEMIYDWMVLPENMRNSYGVPILIVYPLSITLTKDVPFVTPCVRIFDHTNPEWIANSRCGSCLEYSLLYQLLAENSNLTVRSVHNPGEDHSFDEVYINGDWIVVDPSMNRFNSSRDFYEKDRGLDISYVFAEYPNGTKEDITYLYSSLCDLSVHTIDINGNNLSKSIVRFLSNNYRSSSDTGLICTTSDDGVCNVSIGCGRYTLFATGENGYYSRESFVLDNSTSKDIVLKTGFDILNSPMPAGLKNLSDLGYLAVLWLSLSLYWNARSISNKDQSNL